MKIYNVMYSCDCVGEFYQGSFSTEEKAQAYIDKQDESEQLDLSIDVYTVDEDDT